MEDYVYIDVFKEILPDRIIFEKVKFKNNSDELLFAKGKLKGDIFRFYKQTKQFCRDDGTIIDLYKEYPSIMEEIKQLKKNEIK